MLLWFVILYWIISVAIGLYAARKVQNSKDFAIAGRHLPFYMVTATVFATWFGSETVLGIPASFLKGGLQAVVEDPFGSSLCLIFVGLFFAAPLYRRNLLTIGDFYHQRFGRGVEATTTIAIVISYLGWVAAQITALGLVFNVVSHGEITKAWGMVIGSATILIYTFFGGMWAVAITDLLQMIIIVLGMLYIGHDISHLIPGGVGEVIHKASAEGKLKFWPDINIKEIIAFGTAWITMMLGSIPQQDVFQRVTSSRTEKIAIWGSVLGGILYFIIAFIPMFLAYVAIMVDPVMVQGYLNSNDAKASQMILPTLILDKAPLFAQIMFFGALLSAIKSCASATLLAPSVTFTENLLKPLCKIPEEKLLRSMRWVTLGFTVMVTIYAFYSKASIFEMVGEAYQVTLVGAFVPLTCGIFWKKATNQGALLSLFLGISIWLTLLLFGDPDALIPPQFAGLIGAIVGMLLGSLLPQFLSTPSHEPQVKLNE